MAAMLTVHSMKIQSVSELTKSIRGLLETEFPFVTVSGEISNLKRPYSGHLYFTLKDSEAQLRAVLFKQQQRYLDIKPADGLAVICKGRIAVYEARGEYQLLVDFMESRGAGQLQISFDKLKNMLAAEGLFAQSAKKPLPFLPNKVSLITSPEGAAVHDFLRMAENRYPGIPIEVFPVRVQGELAANEIVAALAYLNHRQNSDVIVLCRGGGSLEDLWAFNEEIVARAIYASEIPVVSAVGHEVNFTIADLVADFRAATPSAAAEAVIPDKAALMAMIASLDRRLAEKLAQTIADFRYRVKSHRRMLGDPTILVDNFGLKLKNTTNELGRALSAILAGKVHSLKRTETNLYEMNPQGLLAGKIRKTAELSRLIGLLIGQRLAREREKLRRYASLLDAVSPLAVLGRGYSVTIRKVGRKIVRDSRQLETGDDIEIILDQGSLAARVTAILNRGRQD
jgi:exodeoxyribonuclease VII large subunit